MCDSIGVVVELQALVHRHNQDLYMVLEYHLLALEVQLSCDSLRGTCGP